MRTPEHNEQVALFQWAAFMSEKAPELKWIFSIPNGGLRSKVTAARLKAEGVKAGVADIFLPSASGKWNGLFIEMKAEKGKLSEKQTEFFKAMLAADYLCVVCFGADQAITAIKSYLNRPDLEEF